MSGGPGSAFQTELRAEFCSTVRRIGALGPTADLSSCSPELIAQAKSQVLHAAAVELARFLQSINARSTLVGMAPELLAEIFGHLSVGDRFSATAVCHRWRSVASALPHVWANLTDFGFVSPRLTLALTRARGHPVRLGFALRSIAVNYGLAPVVPDARREDQHSVDTMTFLQCMAARLQQIVALDITVYGAAHSLSPLHDALARPAPRLQSFRFQLLAPGSEFRDYVFEGSAPLLRTLELSHILPPPHTTAFGSVKRLILTVGAPQELDLPTILMNLRNLVELELHTDPAVPARYDPTGNTAHALSVLVPGLETLRLFGHSWWMLIFPFTDCRHVSVVSPEPPITEALWDGAAPPARLIVLSEPKRAFIGGANDSGFVRMAADAFQRDDAQRLFKASIASSLCALVTDTRTWIGTMHPAAVELPRLKYLHIIAYVQEGPDAHCQRLPDWLRVPALRVLRISLVATAEGLPHCFHDVSTAVKSFVTAVAPPELAFIELDGCDVHNLPSGCVRRASGAPLAPFLPTYVSHFDRWDYWLENALRAIPDV